MKQALQEGVQERIVGERGGPYSSERRNPIAFARDEHTFETHFFALNMAIISLSNCTW